MSMQKIYMKSRGDKTKADFSFCIQSVWKFNKKSVNLLADVLYWWNFMICMTLINVHFAQ